jgi:hypothetical protein
MDVGMNASELMILALTDLASAAPKKELPDEETSQSATNHGITASVILRPGN